MKTINKNQLGAETRVLRNLYKKFGRVNAEMQKQLIKRGYVLCELGTGTRSYTSSGNVGNKFFAKDKTQYFGIGVCNLGRKMCNVYRAYIKLVK